MDVLEIAPGLWRWTGRHEEWKEDVGAVSWRGAGAFCLIDPIVPPGDEALFWQSLDGDVERLALPVHVLLTVFWHARQARQVAERYGARIWAHAPARAPIERRAGPIDELFRPGDQLPGGIEAFQARGSEVVYWIAEPKALVAGDVILGSDGGLQLCPESWSPGGGGHSRVREHLRALASLPIESVLVSHGEPVLADASAAFARLLET